MSAFQRLITRLTQTSVGPWEQVTFAALRVIVGIIMIAHGWQKLSAMSEWQASVDKLGIPAPAVSAYLAAIAEFFGGIGLALGLLTPIAAFGIACTLIVAIFSVHWGHGLLAKNGGFEFPLTLLAVAVFFMVHGAGKWSVDTWLQRRAARWGLTQNKPPKIDPVTQASMDSFPASDPPPY